MKTKNLKLENLGSGYTVPEIELKISNFYSMTANMQHCPLCNATAIQHFFRDKRRQYIQCRSCRLVFVPHQFHISAELEKAEYDKHENSFLDEGYRRFLNRTLEPLLSEVKSRFENKATGLDFGCGEGRHLSVMAAEQGVQILNYDLYYFNKQENLQKRYEFVVLTEVIEHLSDARAAWLQLRGLLKPGGILAVMTKRVIDKEAFSRWHYKNDPTHISFYSENTFQFVADWLEMELKIISNDVVFLFAPK